MDGADLLSTTRSAALCAHALLEDSYLICPDLQQDPRFSDNPFVTGPPYLRAYASCLLKSRGHNIGTLCIADTTPRPFSQADVTALRDLTAWAQTELLLTQLSDAQMRLMSELDQAQRAAQTDALTGLWNQGAIQDIYQRAFQRRSRRRMPLSLLMIDIDHFKRVNDTRGHSAGDDVLQQVAASIGQAIRSQDALGRSGGEEFLVVIEDCSHQQCAGHGHTCIATSAWPALGWL
nr:sensor domain-containing diguanylate cyclase [Bacterioplanes sanyensis]